MAVLRKRGMPPTFEVSLTVGAAYLVFFVANEPLQLSGVLAVVVFGLYGSATLKWDMSAAAAADDFPKFWDVLSQVRRRAAQPRDEFRQTLSGAWDEFHSA